MTQIVDISYYKDNYLGQLNDMSDQDLDINIKRSEDSLHAITGYKLKSGQVNFDNMLEYHKALVKDAICIIAESYILSGGYQNKESGMSADGVTNVSLGSFSYTNESKSGEMANIIKIPKKAIEMIAHTGLLYNGVVSK